VPCQIEPGSPSFVVYLTSLFSFLEFVIFLSIDFKKLIKHVSSRDIRSTAREDSFSPLIYVSFESF
jgi:hypothetical protein